MKNEIERKFLVKELPDLTGKSKIAYERYVLLYGDVELRVQHKGDTFELERKEKISEVERTREKLVITQQEFDLLKPLAIGSIVRDGYILSEAPEVSVKVYHCAYEGLIRAEVEFDNEEELQYFQPPEWFGPEITSTPLARDADLIKLSEDQFRELLSRPYSLLEFKTT